MAIVVHCPQWLYRLGFFLLIRLLLAGGTVSAAAGMTDERVVARPHLSVGRGFYDTNLIVEITCATAGAIIHYTKDGSIPDSTRGLVYARPVEISKTTVLRTVAFKTGWTPSSVGTETYIFPGAVIASSPMRTAIIKHPVYGSRMRQALLSLPSLSLVSISQVNGSERVKASIEWLAPGSSSGFQVDCGVSQYGGDYTDFEKKNFRLYFQRQFGATKLRFPIFAGYEHGVAAVDEFDQLELRGGSHDMVERGFYLSNIFVDDTLLEMGHLNPHGRFVHLYLNGTYWGVYHLRERWGADGHRRYLGGSSSNFESINGNLNVGGWADPGVPYDGDGSAWAKVRSLRKDYHAVKSWVDVPQYIDFMLLWMFGACEDEYRCVGPTNPGSGFKFYLNDADGFFKSPANPWYGEPANRTAHRAPGRQPGDGPGSLFSTLLDQADPDYLILLADRIHRACFNSGSLTPARNAERLQVRSEELQKAFVAEAARWGYRAPSDWAAVRDDASRRWLPNRTAELLEALKAAGYYPRLNAPVLNQQGGLVEKGFQVAFTGPREGTVFYTLDGTDPRLPGGAPGPGTLIYVLGGRAGPRSPRDISGLSVLPKIDRNTMLKARVHVGDRWSALNEAFFQADPTALDPGDVQIQERNFDDDQGDDANVLELLNTSSRAVNLRGARFTGGIDYEFSPYCDTPLGPGQGLVLVRNIFKFRQRHGPDVPVAGIYSGRLLDREQIALTPRK